MLTCDPCWRVTHVCPFQTAFSPSATTKLDERVQAMDEMKTLPLCHLMKKIHPDMYPVHNLDREVRYYSIFLFFFNFNHFDWVCEWFFRIFLEKNSLEKLFSQKFSRCVPSQWAFANFFRKRISEIYIEETLPQYCSNHWRWDDVKNRRRSVGGKSRPSGKWGMGGWSASSPVPTPALPNPPDYNQIIRGNPWIIERFVYSYSCIFVYL